MLVQRSLGLEDGLKVINAVIDYAKSKARPIAVVVLDRTGEVVASARMDGRASRFYKAAHRKAYSAAVFEMDTDGIIKFWDRQAEHGHRGPSDWNDTMLTTLPGGVCVVHDGLVVGSIGVAGGGHDPGTGDWDFAEVAFQALGPGFTHTNVMHMEPPQHYQPGAPRG
jgi:glc operon protein GlcG